MRGFIKDERGVSAILGFILVIALVIMAMAIFLTEQVPVDWTEAQYKTMQEVKSSFMELREEIQDLKAGDVSAVKVKMGTVSPTAMLSATTNATIRVLSAMNFTDVTENRYYADNYSTPTRNVYRAYGTYVVEDSPGQNYMSDSYDNDHLYVSAYENHRMWTYLKFHLADSSCFLYSSSEGEFYDDAHIHEVQLLLYTGSVDPVGEASEVLEAGTPIKVEPWLMEDDSWDEGIDWPGPHNESTDIQLENEDVGDRDEWLAFDVTLHVKNHFDELRENQIKDLPLEDNYLSFVLREPSPTKLQNRVAFTSRDNYDGGYDFGPRLRIVYSRESRPGKVNEGVVDFGYIKYEANNEAGTTEFFPSQYFIYEGGSVILQRSPGWYEVMLADPPDFITLASAGGNDIRVTVRRYQIEAGSVDGESIGGTGYTSIRTQREEVENLVDMPSFPNRSEVTITVRTDHKSAWRDYLGRLAAKLNHKMGELFEGVGMGKWDQYGDYVNYDYDSISLTIKGKDLDRDGPQDIYYAEQVIWIDTTLGTFAGGRT